MQQCGLLTFLLVGVVLISHATSVVRGQEAAEGEADGVVTPLELTDDTYDDVVNRHELVLVAFTDPEHATHGQLMEIWSQAAATIADDAMLKDKVLMATVDVKAQKVLGDGIGHTPNLKYHHEGIDKGSYTGMPMPESILQWARQHVGPAVKDVQSEEDLEALRDQASVTAVFYYADSAQEADALKVFTEVAENLRHEYIFAKIKADKPQVILFNDNRDELEFVYDGDKTNYETMRKFFLVQGSELLTELGVGTFAKMAQRRDSALAWFFFEGEDAGVDELKSEIRAAAADHIDRALFTYSDSKVASTMEEMGFTSTEIPALALYTKEGVYMFQGGEATFEAKLISNFISDAFEGRIQPTKTIGAERDNEGEEEMEEGGVYDDEEGGTPAEEAEEDL